jgi:hypothetical protein
MARTKTVLSRFIGYARISNARKEGDIMASR